LALYLYGTISSDKPAKVATEESGADHLLHYLADAFSYAIVGYNLEYPIDTTYQEIRLATSLISANQAKVNFAHEIEGVSYDDLKNLATAKWESILGTVEITDTGLEDERDNLEALRTFYSSLYRAALFPRNIGEMVDGKEKHWSPVATCRQDAGIVSKFENCTKPDNVVGPAIYDGPFSTDSGFWDAYHTVYALQAVLWPERYVETVEGYINHHRENYWVGQWTSPGYKSSMVGTMSDNIIADALSKGLVKPESMKDAWSAAISNLVPLEEAVADTYPSNKCAAQDIPACDTAGFQTPHNMRCVYDGSYVEGDNQPHCVATDGSGKDMKAPCSLGGTPYCDNYGWAHCRVDWLGYAPDQRCDKYGRHGQKEYKEYSFIPTDAGIGEDTARTLNYWNSDAAILKAGVLTGNLKPGDALYEELKLRIETGPGLVFDPVTKFFRPRNKDLSFGESGRDNIYNDEENWKFDEFAWGKHYTEGGPWHFRFSMMHDIPALQALYGEGQELCDLMGSIHEQPSTVHHMGYYDVIHEMAEVPGNCWGQLLQNNQPGHPHMWTQLKAGFNSANSSCKSNAIQNIKKVLNELYTSSEFPGDEDNGEQGAWYVLSTLGLYDIFPGSGQYVFGAPLVKEATIKVSYPTKANPTPADFEWKFWQLSNPCRECSDVASVSPALTADGSFAYTMFWDAEFRGISLTYNDMPSSASSRLTTSVLGSFIGFAVLVMM